MIQKVLAAALLLVLGVAIGALIRQSAGLGGSAAGTAESGGAVAAAGSDSARIIDGLSATLQLEVTERQRLEEQVEILSGQVTRLEHELTALRDGEAPTPAAATGRAQSAARAAEAGADAVQPETPDALAPFLEAGFDPARAEYVKQIQDDLALQRLYLRDQAEREGWLRSPRYRDAMQAITQREDGLQQELGPDDYDRYLYAIGRPNRVVVGDVLANGPAQRAGIQVGDSILSYGGERIYEAGTLVDATRSGTAGMSTAVEVDRDGDTQVVYVPRGPLGINLRVSRVRPGD